MNLVIVENVNTTAEVQLTRKEVNEVCRNVIEAMKNGLPHGAHSIEIFEYILKETKNVLRNLPVKL